MLELWLSTFLAETLLYLPPIWRIKRSASFLVAIYIAVMTARLWLGLGLLVGWPFALLAVFRLFNLARIIKARMHEHYLHAVTARTSIRLFLFHLLVVWGVFIPLNIAHRAVLPMVQIIQLIVATGLFVVTLKNIAKLRFQMPKQFLVDRQLPTVTVAIPARNETTDLEECLKSVLANDYPKLEIIVLDDCSQGATADIIRSFAHDGVRFVKGQEPAARWLAKNQAYQKLLEEANGDLILFCGVDVRFGPQAIRSMVNVLSARQKAMLSVLPRRDNSSVAAAFIQPMRYWWELALPRRLFNRPPVLSTCWLIDRQTLKKLGGFKALSHTILPERFIARELVKADHYSFIRSNNELDVRSVKSLAEQRATAVRMRYPQLRRRPEWVLLLTLANVGCLLAPFVLVVGHFWWPSVNFYLALATCLLLILTHVMVVAVTNPNNVALACINFPLVALTELLIGYTSMIKYEFFTVDWKARNICIPVMHAIPRLPALPDSRNQT